MAQNQNQFALTPEKGQCDLIPQPSTISVQFDPAGSGTLVPGQAVKNSNVTGVGVPKVIPCTADTDDVYGFVNFDIKKNSYVPGDYLEISAFRGNVLYLEATAAISANVPFMIVITGQKIALATTGKTVCGRTVDKATAAGQYIRCYVDLPGAASA